jgi:hypothetical protein
MNRCTVVIENRQKRLIHCKRCKCLNQKVSGQERMLLTHPFADVAPPAERQNLTPSGTYAERGNSVVLQGEQMGLRAGKRPAREADGTAEEGCWRKRMLYCNGGDRDCVTLEVKVTRSSLAKASRIPAGLALRDNLSESERRLASDSES